MNQAVPCLTNNGWTNKRTDGPTDGLSFAYDELAAALTARGRGTSYKSPGTGNWNEGNFHRGSLQETISIGESSFIGPVMTRLILSSGGGANGLINLPTIFIFPFCTTRFLVFTEIQTAEVWILLRGMLSIWGIMYLLWNHEKCLCIFYLQWIRLMNVSNFWLWVSGIRYDKIGDVCVICL